MDRAGRMRICNVVFCLALAQGILLRALPLLAAAVFPAPGAAHELFYDLAYLLALTLPVLFWCGVTGTAPVRVAVQPGPRRRLPLPGLAVVLSLALITVMAYVNYYLVLPFEQAGWLVNVDSTVEVSSLGDALLLVLGTVVIPPLTEELFFRGLLLGRLRPLGTRRALLLSALLFACFHANVSQFVYTFFAGLVFGVCTLLTGDIRLSLCIHALNNAISVAFSLLTVWQGEAVASYGSFYFDLLLVTAAGCCLVYVILRRLREPGFYRLTEPDAVPVKEEKTARGLPLLSSSLPVFPTLYLLFTLFETALNNLAIFYV